MYESLELNIYIKKSKKKIENRDWTSRANDKDVLEKAETLFYENNNKVPFKYKKAWKVLIESPKFHQILKSDSGSDKLQKENNGSSNSSRSSHP